MSDLHESLAAHLQRTLIEKATGRSEELIVDNRPRNVLFAGCLIPRSDAATDNLESAEDFYARLAPSAIQLRFLVRSQSSVTVRIKPNCHVYYRIAPPFWAQQRRTPITDDKGSASDTLVRAYRKCTPKLSNVDISFAKEPVASVAIGESISAAIARAVAVDPDALRPRDNWVIPATSLSSAESLRAWCRAAPTAPQPPTFDVHVEAEIRDWTEAGYSQVIVSLVNRSAENATFERTDYWELALFDAALDVSITSNGSQLQPYSFSALPNSYRFDRDQWGAGINCVAKADGARKIWSESVATYLQPRLEHRQLSGVDLTFRTLSTQSIPSLERIAQAMRDYRRTAWEADGRRLEQYPTDHVFRVEFSRDLADFDRELEEFEAGIALLADSHFRILEQAFRFTNEAFTEVGTATEWRLFQLVFVVRNLVVLAAREWDSVTAADDVEVLWFPTGGGKTEAFLGLLTTALFFDRLRSRPNGVTGVVRLPLRLLSHQQFQRIVRTVSAAESVRRRHDVGGKTFSVGYWIGQGGSPNIVDAATAQEWESNPATCQRWRKISRCPYCGGDVRMRFVRSLWSLAHHCASDHCGNKGDLPLYVVDDELYRFLPSVVVGTVDKLAAFGFQQRFSNLLGWPLSLCGKHGYSPRSECLVPGCKEVTKPAPLKDPVPSLLIQDELHLLKEDLGAFDGHYETAALAIQQEIPGGRPWKIIAATATIEQFDWQAYHLYCKSSRRFPAPGPSWKDTFYSHTTERTNRLFVGMLPFNRSHINSMISALWIYHHEIRRLRNVLVEHPNDITALFGVHDQADEEAFAQALRDYEVSLTYVLTRKAGDQMAESLATQVAGYMRDEGEERVEIRSLTGQTSTIEVEQILEEIEQGGRRTSLTNAPVDAVVATSMISHGVDIDRFNFIAFFGMPRLTAEYIQASSRVGRRFPGLALVVFSPARERDRSHFHLFDKYHQYLERLVEPPAINRWAKFAVRHTLPGLFIGSVINAAARQLNRKLHLERDLYTALHIDQAITLDELTTRVIRYYGAASGQTPEFTSEITHRIELFVNGLRRNAARTLWQASDFRPMMSLRDVEEPVGFMASRYSAEAFDLWMKRRRATAPSGETAIE